MDTFKPKMDILPANQKLLWPDLAPAAKHGLVLYGGTAIALRLGHRESVDFDFFSHAPLDKELLFQAFPFLQRASLLQNELNTLTALVHPVGGDETGVKISFFGNLTFGRVGEPEATEDGVLHVASMDDLMATKVKVIFDRVEAKDYKDIAAMTKAGVSLAKGLSSARAIYGNFPVSEALRTLVYFEGGDLDTLKPDVRKIIVKAVSQVAMLPSSELLSESLSPSLLQASPCTQSAQSLHNYPPIASRQSCGREGRV